MPLDYENINTNISPREFELLVKDFLSNLGKELTSFKIKHDEKIFVEDGEYQIDVLAEFEFLGGKFNVLVECKRYKNRVKREIVQLLFDKIRATGSHKGMIFSTSGFQEGAIKFAKIHGIALIRVIEGKYTYFTRSKEIQQYDPPEWANVPKFVGEFKEGNLIHYLRVNYLDPLSKKLFEE